MHVLITALALTRQMTTIDACTTLIPPPPPIKNVCVCYDIWVSSIFGMVTLAGIIFIVIKEYQSKTLCKGYKYRNTYTICVFFSDHLNYVPIKIRTMAGHLHKVSVNTLLHKCQLKLNKGFIWDTISIDWKTVCILYEGESIELATDIVIPLIDKYRLRAMYNNKQGAVSMMVKQGATWYNLDQSVALPHLEISTFV